MVLKTWSTSSNLRRIDIIWNTQYNVLIVRIQCKYLRFRYFGHVLCIPYNFILPSTVYQLFVFNWEYTVPSVIFTISWIPSRLVISRSGCSTKNSWKKQSYSSNERVQNHRILRYCWIDITIWMLPFSLRHELDISIVLYNFIIPFKQKHITVCDINIGSYPEQFTAFHF